MVNEDLHGSTAERQLAFTVDTHLLRELGALLVGRDSTAVVELIKNAYDADATHVTLHGEGIADHGSITISDDGHGMTLDDFQEKFLRIAGRSKEGGERRSPTFRRKYTGAKGIGRLSAHKLGEALTLDSVPDTSVYDRDAASPAFQARINWTAIETSTSSIDQAREVSVRPIANVADADTHGTVLTITRLFSGWRSAQLNEFLAEVRSTRPDPALLSPPPRRVFPDSGLIGEVAVADTSSIDPGFTIELSGEFAGTESQWPTLLAHTNWMIEIDATDNVDIRYRIVPSASTREVNPAARPRDFHYARTAPGPKFSARIFVRDDSGGRGRRLPDLISRFAKEAGGIRLFLEGFRVLPYGAPRNDWLRLDDDYSVRKALEVSNDGIRSDAKDERTYLLPNSAYFGGVFLHDSGAHGLEMVVNREGFLPGDALKDLQDNVRRGVQLSVRYRAAVAAVAKKEYEEEQQRQREVEQAELLASIPLRSADDGGQSRDAKRLTRWLDAGEHAAQALRSETALVPNESLERQVRVISAALGEVRAANEVARDEQAQLRVLASLGTQIGAFVHEVNGVLGQAHIIRDLLDRLIATEPVPARQRQMRTIRTATHEMIGSLERQAVYLSDSFGAEAQRRRSRQSVSGRVNTAKRLLTAAAAARHVRIDDDVPPEVRTPPMFAAEMNVILTNLLSNAIKAAAASRDDPFGVVRVTAVSSQETLQLLVANTGVRVEPADAERWFQPFETTTAQVDVALGQGLGLGLTLTRRIVEEYGGSIQFIDPPAGFATAVEVVLPNR